MATQKISSTGTSDQSSQDYDDMAAFNDTDTYTDTYTVENADSTTELSYQMNWNKWNGYYMTVTEVGSMIDRKAIWVVGKGFETDPKTKKILDAIRGNGKSSFNEIIKNAVKVYTTGGDFYAERIRDKRGKLRNLKPLNPGTVKVIANNKGIITGYELFPLGNPSGQGTPFKPDNIFHLAWNVQADSIHGTPTLEKLKWTIEAIREWKRDMRVVFHRYVKPITIIPVETDDPTEIATFKTNYDNAYKKTETIVVPKDTVDTANIKSISIPQFSTLDPIPYGRKLEEDFIRAEGVASVLLGVADKEMTEASGKMLYLAWEQVVEANQRFLEEQILFQLGLKVKFNLPKSILEDLEKDEKKDGALNKKPNVTPGKTE